MMRKILVAAFVLTILYNFLFFQTGWGIGIGLLFLVINIFSYIAREQTSKNISLGIITSTLSTIFGFLMGWRSNEILQMANFILATALTLTAFYFYKSTLHFSFEIPELLLTPSKMILSVIKGFRNTMTSQDSSNKEEDQSLVEKKDVKRSVIRGIAIAVPITILLLVLLAKADPIFEKLVENFLDDIWERVIISVIVFFGLLSFGLAKIQEAFSKDNPETSKTPKHKIYELLIVTGSVVTLLGLFILVQLRYFFAGDIGERELHELGINSLTYSEYVRKGFFELLAVSGIASLIMLYVTKFIHKFTEKQKLITQIVSVILTTEIGLLLFSAFQRLSLYQDAHGLTRARIFGFVLLVWLLMMLIIFLIRVFQEIKKEWLFNSVIIPTVSLVLLLNIINIDGLIATKYKPTVNDEIDYFYLTNLSFDGYESWIPAVQDAESIIGNLDGIKEYNSEHYRQLYWAMTTLYHLESKIDYLNEKYGDYSKLKIENDYMKNRINVMRKWQSWNLGEHDAYDLISNNQNNIEKVKNLIERSENINSRISDQIKSQTILDRDTKPPLL